MSMVRYHTGSGAKISAMFARSRHVIARFRERDVLVDLAIQVFAAQQPHSLKESGDAARDRFGAEAQLILHTDTCAN